MLKCCPGGRPPGISGGALPPGGSLSSPMKRVGLKRFPDSPPKTPSWSSLVRVGWVGPWPQRTQLPPQLQSGFSVYWWNTGPVSKNLIVRQKLGAPGRVSFRILCLQAAEMPVQTGLRVQKMLRAVPSAQTWATCGRCALLRAHHAACFPGKAGSVDIPTHLSPGTGRLFSGSLGRGGLGSAVTES